MTVGKLLAQGARALLDLIAPPRCVVCSAAVAEPASLCGTCWSALRQIEQPVCPILGTPFPYDPGGETVSAAALAEPPPWRRCRAAAAFDEASRPLVHALKYGDRQEAGLLMARMMLRAGRELLAEADMIVPVPLHRLRLWQRRFNQSALLARALKPVPAVPLRTDILIRSRHTRSQVGLDSETRRKNVRRAFMVPDKARPHVAGRRIVLVDDVLTTGATAGACAAALAGAGAAHVDVLAFALVLEPKRFHI